ncbi:MAG: potassium-transporting ATPase subunit KdpC [Roseiarcus sp.]
MLDILNSAARASLVTFALCGFAYPLTVTTLGQWLMPFQANGSLIMNEHGAVLGSQLIGQQWDGPQWFHGRPSATTDTDPKDATKTISAPYNAASSSGSNLGPTSQALEDRLVNDWKVLDDAEPDVTSHALPADMLTTSGSGLDPDISPANAALQVKRVAKIRSVPPERVAALVERFVAHRSLGVFGEPRVNVLQLNLAIAKEFPTK